MRYATRRNFLTRTSMGLGALAAASIAQDSDLLARPRQVKPDSGLHHSARAIRVIYLHMSGGPSHLDTFDNKPQMQKHHGEPLPPSVIGKQRLSTMTREQAKLLVAATQQQWGRFGESGMEMNTAFKGEPSADS